MRADGRRPTPAPAEPEHRAAASLQLRQAELEPDREHQEHDAELGEVRASSRCPGSSASACGPTTMPTSEVAEHRRQAQRAGRRRLTTTAAASRSRIELQRLRHRGVGRSSRDPALARLSLPSRAGPSRYSLTRMPRDRSTYTRRDERRALHAPAARSMPTRALALAAKCSRIEAGAIRALRAPARRRRSSRAVDLLLRLPRPRRRQRHRQVGAHRAQDRRRRSRRTGTPAFFVHPAEASHGDLGMITRDDVVIALSNSGETDELSRSCRISSARARS